MSCPADSRDGRTLLQVRSDIDAGTFKVTVRDGDGAKVHERTHRTGIGTHDIPLEGAPGAWRLQVSFANAEGDADVTLWG